MHGYLVRALISGSRTIQPKLLVQCTISPRALFLVPTYLYFYSVDIVGLDWDKCSTDPRMFLMIGLSSVGVKWRRRLAVLLNFGHMDRELTVVRLMALP